MPIRPIASTKLTVPRLTTALVRRPSLLERLDDPTWRLGVVSAPAGFGKTTLLSAWAHERADRPAWFACDSSDAEPVRFWAGLIESLASRWNGVGDDARLALRRSGKVESHIVVSLANDLADVEPRPVIVIDDFHHIARGSPALTAFLAALPDTARLLIGSRRQLPISLARRRLEGDLLELHMDDLRFSETEAVAMLGHHSLELSPPDVTRLHGLTEGWSAGLRLAAISLGQRTDHAQFLDALASTDGPIADYLLTEVLAGLDDGRVEFLMSTSVLDEFDVELCQQITGRADAWSILRELIAAEMFVIQLDPASAWYRYHHLFAAVLAARLKAQNPARLRQVHADAARLLEERGLVARAMRHALAIDDQGMAAAIARRGFDASMYPVDVELTAAAVRLWLHERGRVTAATDPVATLEFIAALQSTAGSDDVAAWLDVVDDAHPRPTPEVTAFVSGIRADHHLDRGQVADALHCVDKAMSSLDGQPPYRALLNLLYPVSVRAHLSAGDIARARTTLDLVMRNPVGRSALDDVRHPAMRAWIAALDGDLGQAVQLAQRSVRRADEIGADLSQIEPGRFFAALAVASVEFERGHDEIAMAALSDAAHLAGIGGRAWYVHVVHLQQAAAARLLGDAESAATHLALARSAVSTPSAEIEATLALEAARQAVRFQPWAAAPFADKLGEVAEATILRAQLALERGDRARAAALVDALPAPATTRQAVEFGMLRALTARDTEAAITYLDEVLAAAAPERFIRTIIEAGPGAPQLLAALPIRSVDQPYVDMLVAASEADVPPVRIGAAEPLIEPLSKRELVVLRYLSSRLTKPEIAAALYVSVNTLKTHMKAVYRKLAVTSRAEAVEVGRRKRLI